MSYAVVRGASTPAQRYLDRVLAAALPPHVPAPRAALPALLLHCLRDTRHRLFMINGATDEKFTCQQMLELAVPVSRAVAAAVTGAAGAVTGAAGAAGAVTGAAGAAVAGARVLALVRDHERAAALYLGLMFAGTVPMFCDPTATKYELVHFLKLVEPVLVFCDAAARGRVSEAVAEVAAEASNSAPRPRVVEVDTDDFLRFIDGYCDDIDAFQLPEMDPDAPVLLLPTSGSTGLPKSAVHTHRGLVMNLPGVWANHTRFPQPTKRAMILTTPQWGTFTILITSSIVFKITLLMSPNVPTIEHVLDMMRKHRPTWTFFGPSFAKALADAATRDHFSSLETVITLGSPATPDIIQALKHKMPISSSVWDGYGMTELQGFVALTDPQAPEDGNRLKVDNTMEYKLVKSDGEEAATDEEGELWIKTPSVIKGYVKNDAELAASMTGDGWFRTGDQFHRDAHSRLAYRRRIKFSFKYNNLLVSPEEVEGVISAVACVAECVVVESARGPGALVALREGDDREPAAAAARLVHHAVDSTLSEHKRLRGGVAVVARAQLPRTHTGKVHRGQAKDLFAALLREGRCLF